MAESKKLSVAEILAAARKQGAAGSGGAGGAAPPTPAAESPTPTPPAPSAAAPTAAATPAAKPAAKPAAAKPAAGGARPSVADILAQARANKAAGGSPAPAEAAKPAPKAAPKPAEKPAAKAAPKAAPAASGASGVKDTASILAAARKDAKPGPLSKAEAAKLKPTAEAAEVSKPKPAVPPMPPKPDYAKPKAKAEPTADRRRFFGVLFGSFLAIGFTAMTATFTLWTLGIARFMFPNILTEPPSRFKVGFPGDYPPGAVEEKFKAQFGVWIAKAEYQGQMQIYALRTVCTHLGCTPNWLEAEQKFKCPCHGSGFYKDGVNFEGPAPRPLERYAISVSSDGQLEVDKSKLFQEEMGQWNDPASFVQV